METMSWAGVQEMLEWLKRSIMYSAKVLLEIDEHYFGVHYDGTEKLSEKAIRGDLATWLFDQDGCDREKIKEKLPLDLYVKVLEDYIDGNHDT